MKDINTQAKLAVLQDLIETMKSNEESSFKTRSSKFFEKPATEVSVSADSPEELEEGLELAKDLVPEEEEDEREEDDLERIKSLYSRIK